LLAGLGLLLGLLRALGFQRGLLRTHPRQFEKVIESQDDGDRKHDRQNHVAVFHGWSADRSSHPLSPPSSLPALRRRRYRVKSAAAKWMAAADPSQGQPRPISGSVGPDCLAGIIGATGQVPAARPQHRRDSQLIEADQSVNNDCQKFHLSAFAAVAHLPRSPSLATSAAASMLSPDRPTGSE